MRATGARFVTVAVSVATEVAPRSSVTQTRTVCGPGAVAVNVACAPVAAGSAWPSPSRSQANAATRPSGSLEALASRRAVAPSATVDGPLSFATGGRSSTRTVTVATAV